MYGYVMYLLVGEEVEVREMVMWELWTYYVSLNGCFVALFAINCMSVLWYIGWLGRTVVAYPLAGLDFSCLKSIVHRRWIQSPYSVQRTDLLWARQLVFSL